VPNPPGAHEPFCTGTRSGDSLTFSDTCGFRRPEGNAERRDNIMRTRDRAAGAD